MFFRFRPTRPQQTPGDSAAGELSSGLPPEESAPAADAVLARSEAAEPAGEVAAEGSDCVDPFSPSLPPEDEARHDVAVEPVEEGEQLLPAAGLQLGGVRRRRGRQLAKPERPQRHTFSAQQRLLLLDTWRRSGLPAGDFAALVGLSKHTLYKWKQLFEEHGPAGLVDQPRGARPGSRLPDLTQRTIMMLKEAHPDWGCQRISDALARGPALPASASAVARVLHEAGYELVETPTRQHPTKACRFERAKPNQLWQTDLFTFLLKRQNRRLYLVAFLDDHSRFVVSYGLHASASTALVLEALEAGLAAYGPPEEILTDNGPQYVTWRGTSQFTKHLEKRGIKQIVARPRRPQTLGKIERFWGSLWREFLEAAVFVDLADARTRIGHYIDYYNFQRVHRGIEGLVPADRFFGAARDVLRTLKERVAANALELARHGQPRAPFYVTGHVDGKAFSVHAEGERLVLRRQDEPRQEITLSGDSDPSQEREAPLPQPVCPQGAPATAQGEPATASPAAPGMSALDAILDDMPQEANQPQLPEEGGDA